MTQDELETYHYPEDKDLKPDQDQKEIVPVDQTNHCLDSDRYCTISTYLSTIKRKVIVPDEERKQMDLEERIKMLKKPSKNKLRIL
jgi:hypothetical protein